MEGVILIHDIQGEKNTSGLLSAARRYVAGSSVNILRGELLLPIRGEITQRKDGKIPHNYYVNKDPTISLYCREEDVSPLSDDDFRLLEGIRSRTSRHDVFRLGNKLEWAPTLHTDSVVYATIPGENVAKTECTTAVIRYVGPIGSQSGIQFGIEILDDQYRGLGTSDGTFQDDRYFTCEDKCGLFVSLEKISSEPTVSGTPVQQQSASVSTNTSYADAARSSGPAHHTRSRDKLESNVDKLSKGQKVIVYDKKGNKCTGVVQWIGQLKGHHYTYVGIKTDKKVRAEDFDYGYIGNTQQQMSTGKGHSLFVPESLVETPTKRQAPPKGPPQEVAQLGDSIASEFGVTHTKLLRDQEVVLRQAEEVKRSNVERRVMQENNPELAQVKSAMESSVDITQQQQMLDQFNNAARRGSSEQRPISQGDVPSHGQSAQLPRQHSQRPDHTYDVPQWSPATKHRLMNQGKSASVAEGEGVYNQYHKEMHPVQQHLPQNFEQPLQDHQRLHGGNVQGFQPQLQQPPYPPQQGQQQYPEGHASNAQPGISAVAGTGNAGVHSDLGIQSRIQIPSSEPQHPHRYGVIRWIGALPEVQGLIAGIELDEEMEGCTDGTLQRTGQQFFSCAPGKGIYYPLHNLAPDERFSTQGANYYDNPLRDAPLEELEDQHISGGEVQKYVGDERGIQGHQNSCYLDATVFGLFALFDGFDNMFLTDSTDQQRRDISYILWKGIVNPLRKHGLVRFESVMKLRDKLEEFGKMKGITQDEKDPEEFLNMLFKHTLQVAPFISIKRPFGVEEEYFVQLFMEPDESLKLPSVDALLAKMFREQNISFTEVPSKLLIQVPRFGKQFKTFEKIIPEISVNVAELMDIPPHQCFVCDKPAKKLCYQCKQDVHLPGSNEPPFFCDACWKTFHDHSKRQGHSCEWCDEVKDLYQISELELLSVICIETSHYVCFTRSEDKWVFFDSMANRVYDKFNIPKVADCTDVLNEWVYPADGDRSRLLNTPPRDLPEYVRRFTQDIYLCVYIQPDVGMY